MVHRDANVCQEGAARLNLGQRDRHARNRIDCSMRFAKPRGAQDGRVLSGSADGVSSWFTLAMTATDAATLRSAATLNSTTSDVARLAKVIIRSRSSRAEWSAVLQLDGSMSLRPFLLQAGARLVSQPPAPAGSGPLPVMDANLVLEHWFRNSLEQIGDCDFNSRGYGETQ
jgi:hypothetical protein